MPIARFQTEDGRIARFEVPEGTTPEQAQVMMENHFKQPIPEKPLPPIGQQAALIPGQGTDEPTPAPAPYQAPSFSEKSRAAVQAGGGMLTGAVLGVPAMMYGVGRDIYERTLGDGKAGVSEAGKYTQQAFGTMPFMPKEGSLGQEYMGKVGEAMSVLPPVIPELNMMRGAVQAGKLEQQRFGSVPPVGKVADTALASKQAIFKEGREYGYKATPSAVTNNSGLLTETIARKQKLEAETSINNATARANDIRKEWGLSEGGEIKHNELIAIREQLGKSKENIISELPSLVTNEKFRTVAKNDLKKLFKKDYFEENYADLSDGREINTSTAMKLIADLRQKADEKFSVGAGLRISPEDQAAGKNALSYADDIEAMIEKQLSADPSKFELLNKFRQERVKTAQTYAVEKALNPATGEIIGSQLAAQYKKDPLLFTGALKRAAEHAEAFPLNNKEVSRVQGSQSVNPMNTAFGIAALTSGHPFIAAGEIGLSSLPAKMLTSDWMQNRVLKLNPALDKAAREYKEKAYSVKMDNPTKQLYMQASAEAEKMAKQRQIEANDIVLQAASKGRAALQQAETLAKKNAKELAKATEARILLEAGEIRGRNMVIEANMREFARLAGIKAEAQALADAGITRGKNMQKLLNKGQQQ